MAKSDQPRKVRAAKPGIPADSTIPDKSVPWRRHGVRLIAIWGLLAIAYSNSFQAGLVFDNSFILERDPRIREATAANVGAILTGEYSYVSIGAGLYRPFATLTYLVNYAVLGNGLHPAGYHAVNFLLHAANTALVYALGLLMFEGTAAAWALAAIWGLHPLATESVTNIIGRADLLAAMGVLAGLLCYVCASTSTGRSRVAWLAGVAAAQAVGLFSKESAVVLPGVMLLYDLGGACFSLPATSWRKRWPAYAVLALPLALYFYLRSGLHSPMHIEFVENPLVGAGFWAGRLTAVKVIGKYLWLFVWPARLSADYSFNAVPLFGQGSGWEDAKALIALAVCLGAAALAIWLAKQRGRAGKPLWFFLLFFFVALSPVSNVFLQIGSIMAERFLYLPAVGLAGCMVAAVWLLLERKLAPQRAVWAVLVMVCLALTARTYARNIDWQDDRSLWTSAAEAYPESARPHYNLANTLATTPGMLPEAIEQYRAALRIRPDNPDIHNNLGMALMDIPDRVPEAIAEFQEALKVHPDSAELHGNLGLALAKIPERAPEAVPEFEFALRANSGSAELHNALGMALAQTPGRMQEAIAQFQEALRIKPDLAEAHSNLGRALTTIPGQLPQAIAEFRQALRTQPNSPVTHNNLGLALAKTPGGVPEAIAEFQAALKISGDYADAHYNLGLLLSQMPGRRSEAIAELEAGERINPDQARQQILDELRAGR